MFEYVSILEASPINIIVFILCLALSIVYGVMGSALLEKDKTCHLYIGGLIGGCLFIFLSWLYMGKSFAWTKPIGNWLVGG